jgi:hypothetical protein
MKKHLPLNDWHVFHYLRGGSPNSFGKNTFGNWQGSTNSLRPTVVCESCNSGWMSAIETQAKECLISLIAGQSFDVTDEHQTKLSRWVSLKTMVCEYDTDGPKLSSTEDCHDFKFNKLPNSQWGIWIAACQAPNWRVRIMRQPICLRTEPVETTPPPNVQFVTIALNNLLIHVRQSKLTNMAFPPVADGLLQIWPTQSSISWPPTRILNGMDADFIGTSLFRWLGIWPPAAHGLPPDGTMIPRPG